ncbi:hypothetical protein [Streptomyces lydicus]|uniref:hypothetical protein n=1 Tax=Streptomyces lydicus TaxID=47763 RepID=UPI0036F948EA
MVAVLGEHLGDFVQHPRRRVGRAAQMQEPAVVRAGAPVDPQVAGRPAQVRERAPWAAAPVA